MADDKVDTRNNNFLMKRKRRKEVVLNSSLPLERGGVGWGGVGMRQLIR
jgi:hypothetical protein